MNKPVLVTYATKSGSTHEIAEVVAETLKLHGLEVDIQAVKNVRNLEDYDAVVMGMPIYIFHWPKEAHHFLSMFQKSLERLPVSLFTGGPTMSGDEDEWQTVRSQADQELVKHPWLKPISIEIVGGRHDPDKLRFPFNLIPAMRQMPASDLRDWEAIKGWAKEVAIQLQTGK
jgi:menaquinone-dependent protoporphyrinogen oxidase